MKLAIHELNKAHRIDTGKIESFLKEHTFPIVEGNNVTFIYHGEADAVYLKHWIFALESRQPFQRLAGTDLWYKVVELPPDSRVEYKLEVVIGDEHRLIQDPLNPHLARDPFGANSVCHSADHEEPEWVHEDADARPGRIEGLTLYSHALGGPRQVGIYLPARFRQERRYPLLIVHDGEDFVRFASIKTVLDNLIHRAEIPPMIVCLTQPENRLEEYANDPRHADYLTKELVPKLEAVYPLVNRPSARGLVGASFGAVAAFSTAIRYPDQYRHLLLLSGSFAFTDIGDNPRGPYFAPIVEFMNEYRNDPVKVCRNVYVGCGMYESLIYENRSLIPILQKAGMEVRFEEVRDGHNWENWRDRLRAGLSYLFPGPIWLIYE